MLNFCSPFHPSSVILCQISLLVGIASIFRLSVLYSRFVDLYIILQSYGIQEEESQARYRSLVDISSFTLKMLRCHPNLLSDNEYMRKIYQIFWCAEILFLLVYLLLAKALAPDTVITYLTNTYIFSMLVLITTFAVLDSPATLHWDAAMRIIIMTSTLVELVDWSNPAHCVWPKLWVQFWE